MCKLMVTGHRKIEHPDGVKSRLDLAIAAIAPEVAISGGAEGADTIFARAALDAGVDLWLFLPNGYYRQNYPKAVPDEIVEAASRVEIIVDRPRSTDWRARWRSEKWWRDNFARNSAMVRAADMALIVSGHPPSELTEGGTAACYRELVRSDVPSQWIEDSADHLRGSVTVE